MKQITVTALLLTGCSASTDMADMMMSGDECAAEAGMVNLGGEINFTFVDVQGANLCNPSGYRSTFISMCTWQAADQTAPGRSGIIATDATVKGTPQLISNFPGKPVPGTAYQVEDGSNFPASLAIAQLTELRAATFKTWLSSGGGTITATALAPSATIPNADQLDLSFDIPMKPGIGKATGTFRIQGTVHCDPFLGLPH